MLARLRPVRDKLQFLVCTRLVALLPATRAYGIKRRLLTWAGVKVGDGTHVHSRAVFHTPHVVIGRGVWIGSDVHFHANPRAFIEIGDRCAVAPHVVFMTGSHAVGGPDRRAGDGFVEGVRIGPGSAIGVRALFLPGSGVGAGCVVAAGSVVNKRFGDDLFLAGAPARVSRRLSTETPKAGG